MSSPSAITSRQEDLRNWAGNFVYGTNKVLVAETIQEIQSWVRNQKNFKVLGTRHCFNSIANSEDHFLSLQKLNRVVNLDKDNSTVKVEGGINYGQLCPALENQGYALHNLASLPHISIAGASSTATHGSGVKNGNLSTAVIGMELVTASGDIISFNKENDSAFNGVVVGLGALGVITKLKLAVEPTFQVRQFVFEDLPMSALDHFDEIMSAGYSVSLFTDWKSDNFNEVWVKCKTSQSFQFSKEFFGARAARSNLHPIANVSPEHCTEQMGVAGPWFDRLPHFKMGFTPSSGKELQSEYFVPRQNAVDAILAVSRLSQSISTCLLISEIRSIDADSLWMSPCYQQESVAIHFTWEQDVEKVGRLLPLIEKVLEPFDTRPHWGKLFTTSPKKLRNLYPKIDEFINLMTSLDPGGKFRNDFIRRIFE